MADVVTLDSPALVVRAEDEIAHVLHQVGEAAALAGGLSVSRIAHPNGAQQWVVVTFPVFPQVAKTPGASGAKSAQLRDMESALKSFEHIPNLEHNSLARMVNLDRFAHPGDNPLFVRGIRLKRALRWAIEELKRGPEEDKPAGRFFEARFISRMPQAKACRFAEVSESTALRHKSQWLDRLLTALIEPHPAGADGNVRDS